MSSVRNLLISCIILWICTAAAVLPAQQGRGVGRISGNVIDTEGNPLAGVIITAVHSTYSTSFTGKSNKRGNWAVSGLGSGNFLITARVEGYENLQYEMKISQFSTSNPPIKFIMMKVQSSRGELPISNDAKLQALFNEGNVLYAQKNFSEATHKFQEFLVRYPNLYHVNINLGNCYIEMKNYDQAISCYNKVLNRIQEEKGSLEGSEIAVHALTSLGETYIKMEDLPTAGQYLEQAIAISPLNEKLYFNIGEIYFNQGETDKAITFYIQAQTIKPDWSPTYRRLGYAFLNKGEYRKALESFTKFLMIVPDSPQASAIKNLIPEIEKLIKILI